MNQLNSQSQNSLHVAAEVGNVNIGTPPVRGLMSSGFMSSTRRENRCPRQKGFYSYSYRRNARPCDRPLDALPKEGQSRCSRQQRPNASNAGVSRRQHHRPSHPHTRSLGIWLASSPPRSHSRPGQFGSHGVALGGVLRSSHHHKTNSRLAVRSAVGAHGGFRGADAAGSIVLIVCWLKGDERIPNRTLRWKRTKLAKNTSVVTPIPIPSNSLRVPRLY